MPAALGERHGGGDRLACRRGEAGADRRQIGVGIAGLAVLVEHEHVHPQVRRQRGGSKSSPPTRTPLTSVIAAARASTSRPCGGPSRCAAAPGGLGERDQGPADLLGQRAHERLDELAAVAGDLPVERRLVDLVERRERHPQRDAVEWLAGREAIRERDVELAAAPRVGVVGEVDQRSVGVAQLVGGELEQLRGCRRGIAPPAVEVPGRHDVGRDALVVEVVHGVVVEEVAAADPGLEGADLGDELPVAFEEAMLGVPVAEDEGVADEQLTRQRPVDAVVADRAAGDDRQAVQRHRLGGDGAAAATVPARLAVGALDEVGCRSARPTPAAPRRRGGPTPDWSRPARRPSPTVAASSPAPSRER